MAGQQYIPRASDTAPLPAVGQGTPSRPRGPRLLLQGAGLVAVAVVAGLVWWLIRSGGGDVGGQAEPSPTADPLTSGEFTYAAVAGPERAPDCEANAYGDIADWFAGHPCERLSRGLFSTKVGEARALVSVVLVTMPDSNSARQLKLVADTDGTGNVNDLVRDGTASLPGAPDVAGGHYASEADGAEVTIVEAEFFDEHSDDDLLAQIGTDSLRLSTTLR